MPSAATKFETKKVSMDSNELDTIINAMETHFKNMIRKKAKLSSYGDKSNAGIQLDKNQERALDAVIDNLELSGDLKQTIMSFTEKADIMDPTKHVRDVKQIEEILKIQTTLNTIITKEGRQQIISSGIDPTGNKFSKLELLRGMISPGHIKEKDFGYQLAHASEHIVCLLERSEKKVLDKISYNDLKELIDTIHTSLDLKQIALLTRTNKRKADENAATELAMAIEAATHTRNVDTGTRTESHETGSRAGNIEVRACTEDMAAYTGDHGLSEVEQVLGAVHLSDVPNHIAPHSQGELPPENPANIPPNSHQQQTLAPPNDDGTFLNTMNAVQTTQIVQSIGDGRSFSFLQDSELEQDVSLQSVDPAVVLVQPMTDGVDFISHSDPTVSFFNHQPPVATMTPPCEPSKPVLQATPSMEDHAVLYSQSIPSIPPMPDLSDLSDSYAQSSLTHSLPETSLAHSIQEASALTHSMPESAITHSMQESGLTHNMPTTLSTMLPVDSAAPLTMPQADISHRLNDMGQGLSTDISQGLPTDMGQGLNAGLTPDIGQGLDMSGLVSSGYIVESSVLSNASASNDILDSVGDGAPPPAIPMPGETPADRLYDQDKSSSTQDATNRSTKASYQGQPLNEYHSSRSGGYNSHRGNQNQRGTRNSGAPYQYNRSNRHSDRPDRNSERNTDRPDRTSDRNSDRGYSRSSQNAYSSRNAGSNSYHSYSSRNDYRDNNRSDARDNRADARDNRVENRGDNYHAMNGGYTSYGKRTGNNRGGSQRGSGSRGSRGSSTGSSGNYTQQKQFTSQQ